MTPSEAAMKTVVNGPDELRALVGADIGPSDWVLLDQPRINAFANAIDDDEWLHVDVERARQSPFGTTIAHGFLTMSLVPPLLRRHLEVGGFRMGLNYGLNKLRFPAVVEEGSRVRFRGRVADVVEVSGGLDMLVDFSVEIAGKERPGAAGRLVFRYLT